MVSAVRPRQGMVRAAMCVVGPRGWAFLWGLAAVPLPLVLVWALGLFQWLWLSMGQPLLALISR